MKLVRFMHEGRPVFGSVEDGKVRLIEGDVLSGGSAGKEIGALGEIKLLAPATPTKIIAIGLNYMEHIKESGLPQPEEPLIFLKPPSAVLEPEGLIQYPRASKRLDYEGELAVVIGKQAHNVSRSEAADYVLGYTCGNDVTARDLQHGDGQWTRGKGFDTFCPLGPWIVTDVSPDNLRIQSRLNGEVKQDNSTADMLFNVPALVSYISRIMTLRPFDVIMTGTPCGVGPMQVGDVIEVEIEGIGVLRNRVAQG